MLPLGIRNAADVLRKKGQAINRPIEDDGRCGLGNTWQQLMLNAGWWPTAWRGAALKCGWLYPVAAGGSRKRPLVP
jgi:hypothetical protein